MRKLLFFPFLLLALTATACSGDPIEPEGSATEQPETPGNDNDEDETPNNDGRYLVLYCSRTSNTEGIAQRIGTALGCDFIEVEPETPYDTDYNAMLERSQQEQAAIEAGNFPPVKTSVESFEEYDIIFIGYPIWYSHMATPMQTSCMNTRQNLQASASHCSQPAEAVEYRLRSVTPGNIVPTRLTRKACC